MRNSYWQYIENMIFDIEINEPDQPSFKNTPKKLYSGRKQICECPLLQTRFGRQDVGNRRKHNCPVTEHHLYSGRSN